MFRAVSPLRKLSKLDLSLDFLVKSLVSVRGPEFGVVGEDLGVDEEEASEGVDRYGCSGGGGRV